MTTRLFRQSFDDSNIETIKILPKNIDPFEWILTSANDAGCVSIPWLPSIYIYMIVYVHIINKSYTYAHSHGRTTYKGNHRDVMGCHEEPRCSFRLQSYTTKSINRTTHSLVANISRVAAMLYAIWVVFVRINVWTTYLNYPQSKHRDIFVNRVHVHI